MQEYVLLDPDTEEWERIEGNAAIDLTMQQKVFVYMTEVTNDAGMVSRHQFLAKAGAVNTGMLGPYDIRNVAGVVHAWMAHNATVSDLNLYGIDLPLELKEQIKRETDNAKANDS